MKNVAAWSVLIVCASAISAFAQNKVVFDNQSGEPALVKLIGPTQTEVEVPNGTKAGTDAAAGRYIIKVRYGTPGNYRYTKGDEFTVTETATARSETTITLHKVVAGNYDSRPISESDFNKGQESAVRQSPAPSPEAAGHPTWQKDFEAFVLAYQDAIRKDAPSCNDVFAGRRVTWTLTFRELSTSAGKDEVFFDGVRRKLTKGGVTGPWAQFFPSATGLPKWKVLPKGTRVSISGTIVRAVGGEVTDNVTGEKVPWGVAQVKIDEPNKAPEATQ